jgi:phosphopantetheinyl transferase
MTPKEKAIEITLLYYNLGKHLYVPMSFAKQCALIAIDELIEVACDISDYDEAVTKEYWEEVKQEIKKL